MDTRNSQKQVQIGKSDSEFLRKVVKVEDLLVENQTALGERSHDTLFHVLSSQFKSESTFYASYPLLEEIFQVCEEANSYKLLC